MADQKVTQLTALNATPASNDILYAIDVSDTTDGASGTSKQVTYANLLGTALTRLAAAPVSLGSISDEANTNAALSTVFSFYLTNDAVLRNPTNGSDGFKVIWRIKQDGSGGHSLTLDSKFRIPSTSSLGSTINSATFKTALATTMLGAIYNAADDKWDVFSEVEGY